MDQLGTGQTAIIPLFNPASGCLRRRLAVLGIGMFAAACISVAMWGFPYVAYADEAAESGSDPMVEQVDVSPDGVSLDTDGLDDGSAVDSTADAVLEDRTVDEAGDGAADTISVPDAENAGSPEPSEPQVSVIDSEPPQPVGIQDASTSEAPLGIQGDESFTVNFSSDGTRVGISLAGVAGNATKVRFAIWSDTGGQDDLKWYDASKSMSGLWYVTVPLMNHRTSGTYQVHVYATVGGKQALADHTSFAVSAPSANVEVVSVDEAVGTYTVRVSDVSAASAVETVYLPTWVADDQSDIKWLKASSKGDGTWEATVPISSFSWKVGSYKTHCYLQSANGAMDQVGALTQDMRKPAASVTVALGADESTATITAVVPRNASAVRIPVWSDEGGQDDLVWYSASKQADGTWKTSVPISAHGNAGIYQAHCYAVVSGVQQFIESASFEVGEPTATVEVVDVDEAAGTFTVEVSGVESTSAVAKIQLPTWVRPDQSDIKWREAARTTLVDGTDVWRLTVSMADHAWLSGTYHVHCYLTAANGTCTRVGMLDQDMALPGEGGIVMAVVAADQKSVTLLAKAPGAKAVSFPVWSDEGGQDDIVWYSATRNADGIWTATVPVSKHASTGSFAVHCYEKNGNTLAAIGSTAFEIAASSATVEVTGVDEALGRYTVTVSGVATPSGVSKVLLPTWVADDQSDITWISAIKDVDADGNTVWTADVSMGNHRWVAGTYKTHCYITDGNGVQAFVGAVNQAMVRPERSVTSVLNPEETTATVTVVVPDTRVTAVSVPVWSDENDQDDLVWYTARKQADGTWTATVPVTKHRSSGQYEVHAYETVAGKRTLVANTVFTVDEPSTIDECYVLIADTKNKTSSRIDVQTVSGTRYLFLPSTTDLSALELRFASGGDEVSALVAGSAGGGYVAAGEGIGLDIAALNSTGSGGQHVLWYRDDETTVPVKLVIMKSSGLRTVFIVSDDPVNQGRAWIEADRSHERKASGSVVVLDTDGTLLNAKSQDLEYIRGRGNGTWSASDKRPYQIKLDKKADLLGTGDTAKKWVLLANSADSTMLRNTLALDLAKEMGISTTPEYAPIDLYYDGEYRGTYLLVEKIDIASGSVPIHDLESDIEDANDGVDLETLRTAIATNKYGQRFQYVVGVADPTDFSGGYLIEMDNPNYTGEVCWFQTPSGYFTVKNPEFLSKKAMEYISCYVYEATECLDRGGSISVGGTTRHTSDYFDVDSLAKVYLLNEFCKNIDYFNTSTYFFLPSDADAMSGNFEKKLYSGPAWDFDACLGLRKDWTQPALFHSYEGYALAIWPMQATDDPNVQTYVRNYYRTTFDGLIDDIVLGDKNACGETVHSLAYYRQQIAASQRMDEKIWGITNFPNCIKAYAGYQANYDYLVQWIGYRNRWMSGDIAKWNGSRITNKPTVYNGVDYALVFDYNYYVSRNRDVVAVVGADPMAVLRHFVEHGIKEGRQGSLNFNAQTYFHKYADLRAAYGTNLIELTRHYIRHGFYEGRQGV